MNRSDINPTDVVRIEGPLTLGHDKSDVASLWTFERTYHLIYGQRQLNVRPSLAHIVCLDQEAAYISWEKIEQFQKYPVARICLDCVEKAIMPEIEA